MKRATLQHLKRESRPIRTSQSEGLLMHACGRYIDLDWPFCKQSFAEAKRAQASSDGSRM